MMNAKCEKFKNLLGKIDWFPPLLARITVGWVFAESGWGKFQHLSKVVEYFQSLEIPGATIQAPFVAGVELIGGVFLLLGVFTRISSLFLIGTMVVAILTAKRDSLESVSDLFGLSEYLYIVILVWLMSAGAGKAALGRFLCKKSCAQPI